MVFNYEDEVLEEFSEYGMFGFVLYFDFLNMFLVYVVYCYSGGGFSICECLLSFCWNGIELIDEIIIFNDIFGGGIYDGFCFLIIVDEKIFMIIGDCGSSDLFQDMNSLNGKILCMNFDGMLLEDNFIVDSYIYFYGYCNL